MKNIGRRPSPIGTKKLSPQGYIRIRVDETQSPFKEWEYKHRLVMEEVIGRKLLPREEIHHINEDRLDNRPENLELCSSKAEHTERHFGPSHTFICKFCGNEFLLAPNIVRNRIKFNGTPPTYCNAKCQQADLKGKPFRGKPGHPKGGYREDRRDTNGIAS